MEETDYLLALSQCALMGPSRLARLRAFFNSWEKAWSASQRELQNSGLEGKIASRLTIFRKKFNYKHFLVFLERHNIKTLTRDEVGYPKLLKQIYLPPPLLYYRGKIELCDRPTIAIVGTRKPSAYGKQVAEKIVAELVEAGLTIISGLALGIDALTHEITLTKKGHTVAVLGSGPEAIYPIANFHIGESIAERGCLLSEFRPGIPPLKSNFPRRNRLIAGLCLGTLVIEASEKSGSLITARHALQENREVMMIPGNIYSPLSSGTNAFIQMGARLITCAQDILSALGLEQAMGQSSLLAPQTLSLDERNIVEQLGYEPLHINELVRALKLDISLINSRLTIMEIKGLVKNIGNMNYIRLF